MPSPIFLVFPWTIGHCGYVTLRTWQVCQCFKIAVPVAFVLNVAFPQCCVVCPQFLFWVELFLFDHVELVKVSFLIPQKSVVEPSI